MTTTTPRRAEILAASELAVDGWCAVRRFLAVDQWTRLVAEANDHRAMASEWHDVAPADEDSGARGRPGRWLLNAPGGPLLRSFYRSPELSAWLRSMTGIGWVPAGRDGSYSYYERPGHHLDLHRDVDICDLTVITCLGREGGPLPALVAFPRRLSSPLAEIRTDVDVGARTIDLEVGESLVMLGGVVPHRLPPLTVTARRVVAPLCFTPAPEPP